MPPGFRLAFEDRDLVPQQRQVEGRGQARRTRARHGHLAAGRRHFARSEARGHVFETVRQQDRIGDEAMHLAHIDRLVQCLAAAPVVAGMLADAAGRRGQRIVQNHRLERVVEPALFEQRRGTAEYSCAADNCSRRATAPGCRTRPPRQRWAMM